MQTRRLGERGLVFAKSQRDAKMMRRRERGVLLVGIAVLLLGSSPTTAQPSMPGIPLKAPLTISPHAAISNVTLLLENDNANGAVFGGLATNTGGFGIVGLASDTSSANFGVAGATQSSTGTGVYGLALSSTCPFVTLPLGRGQTCVGVIGQSVATSGLTAGVIGWTQSPNGIGVAGEAVTGGFGVEGTVASSGGAGVLGVAPTSVGVLGQNGGGMSFDTFDIGVVGQSPSGVGVEGSTSTGAAVRGRITNVAGALFSGVDLIGNETFGVDSTGRVRIANPNFGTSCVAVAACTNELFFKDNGQIRSGDDNHRIIFDRINNNLELLEYGDLIFSPGATLGARTQSVTFKSGGSVGIGTATPDSGLEVVAGGDSVHGVSTGIGTGVTGESPQGVGVKAIGNQGTALFVGMPSIAGAYYILAETLDTSVSMFQVDTGGNVFVRGNLTVNGAKSSAATLADGRTVALYAMESPENWFEDFGGAQLRNGVAWVPLEPTFAQTVNPKMDYRVFLTPNGDCAGLYVAKKTATGFEVRELGGGRSDVKFDYRIVAKRRGFETVRLSEVPATLAARPGQSPVK